ncbi:DUF5719 family protein [Parafrankia sp. FMc2]|uniref:DUF5719 family protein n=1 Tax=Parafrankia sp. FMc2 TaxID=3233196 RepID=UPI0034D6C0AD
MRPDRRWRVPVAFGLVCVAAVVASALTTAVPRTSASAVPRSVTSATLLCPDLGLDGRVPQLLDLVRGAGPGGAVQPSDGSALLDDDRQHDELLRLPPGGDPAGRSPGERTGGGPLRLVATGEAAAGLTATVTSPGSGAGPLRARCEQPRAHTWFAGPSTAAGRDPVLYWTNAGPRPARVDVGVVSPDGTSPRTEITIPPGRTVSRRLAALAPEAAATAIDIRTTAGRVLSWLVDRASGSGPQKATPVPPTAGPAARVLVGGLLTPAAAVREARGPAADLVIAVPGRAATVRVTVLSPSGARVPAGLEAVRIPAGTTVHRPIALAPATASAVLVESTDGTGVVAALRLSGGGPDPVWVAGSMPERPRWTGQVSGDPVGMGVGPAPPGLVVAAAPVPRWTSGALVLVAPDRAATAWVDGTRVDVGAGRVVLAELPAGRTGARVVGSGGTLVATQVLGASPPVAMPPAPGAGVPPAPADVPLFPVAADPPAEAVSQTAVTLTAPVPRTVSAVVPLVGAWRYRSGPAPVADPRLLVGPAVSAEHRH